MSIGILTCFAQNFIIGEKLFLGDIMIRSIRVFQSYGFDPHMNLAIEQLLLENTPEDCCTLYLWQNQNTVVIGRNQNAWAECRLSLLEQEHGKLARRLSGGGAVFHDTGNLNFTFLTSDENYDLDKQLSVIQTACSGVGIQAEKSGRNDLLAQGHKFSGNAFYHSKGKAYHHGTLLIDVNMDKLSRYLSPPKAKLEAKGVTSVRSRVINLRELAPALTCDAMRQYMVEAFEAVYGMKAKSISLSEEELCTVTGLAAANGSWDWLYGPRMPFSFACEAHFSWGHIQLQLQVESGIIHAAKAYSDAMDWSLAPQVEQVLTGCRFTLEAMAFALKASPIQQSICADLIQMLTDQNI